SPFLHDCARTDETDTDYHTLHDVCLSDGTGAQNRYSGLHEAAARHCDKWKGAESGTLLLARSMPSDRQGENKCDHYMDEVIEAVVPVTQHGRPKDIGVS